MRIIEKALCILAIIGYIFVLLFWSGGEVMTAFSLLSLSCLYLFFSFALLNGIKLRAIFKKNAYNGIRTLHIVGAAITGFVLFISCTSLIFATLMWTGNKVILAISTVFCLIVLVVSLVSKSKDAVYYGRILTRTLPLLSICLFLFVFAPRNIALNIIYRDHPAYIEAVKEHWKNHSDKDARRRMEEEWNKFHSH